MKILGREPALWISTIGSILTVLVALNVDFLNAGQASAIVALLSAIVIAITTRPAAPAVFTGVLSAGVALVTEYGLHLSDALVGSLTGVVLTLFALVSRGQISPRETSITRS